MSYNRDLWSALEQMGLNPNRHLPTEGVDAQEINFKGVGKIEVFVMGKGTARAVGITQRTRGVCPACGNEFALGNLKQHYFGARRRGKLTRACPGRTCDEVPYDTPSLDDVAPLEHFTERG